MVQEQFLTVTSLSNNYVNVVDARTPFAQQVSGKMILAPLTRGGNLPFRRLCEFISFVLDVVDCSSMGDYIYPPTLLRTSQLCFGAVY